MFIIVNTRKIGYKLLTFGFGMHGEEGTWGLINECGFVVCSL